MLLRSVRAAQKSRHKNNVTPLSARTPYRRLFAASAEKRHGNPGSHTLFAAGWFRVLIVVAALGTLLILSVPYLLGRLSP